MKEQTIVTSYCVRDVEVSDELTSLVKEKINEIRSEFDVKSFKFGMTDSGIDERFSNYRTKNTILNLDGKMILLYENKDRQPIIDFEKIITKEFKGVDPQCKNKKLGGGELGYEPKFYVYVVISSHDIVIESVDKGDLSV